MANEKKIYVGSGNVSKNPKYIKANISEKGLNEMLNNLQEYLGHKFARVDIAILEEPNKYGKNVEISLNNWKPAGSEPQQSNAPEPTFNNDVQSGEEMPLSF